jgi:hypothetical protein
MKVESGSTRLLVERPSPRDGETPRAAVRRGTATVGGRGRRVPRSVLVNLAESPLGWLRARGHVSERQFAAGEQLRTDWERAQLPPRVTMCWDAPPPAARRAAPDAPAPTPQQLAARRRRDGAAAAVGPGLRDILWRVVCAGEGMREAERALDWPARAGKLVLGMALDRLADYYRIR